MPQAWGSSSLRTETVGPLPPCQGPDSLCGLDIVTAVTLFPQGWETPAHLQDIFSFVCRTPRWWGWGSAARPSSLGGGHQDTGRGSCDWRVTCTDLGLLALPSETGCSTERGLGQDAARAVRLAGSVGRPWI